MCGRGADLLPCLTQSAPTPLNNLSHPAPHPGLSQAARADALAHFSALLQELHLAPDARWRDYADRISRDAQVRRLRCLLAGCCGWLGLWGALHLHAATCKRRQASPELP